MYISTVHSISNFNGIYYYNNYSDQLHNKAFVFLEFLPCVYFFTVLLNVMAYGELSFNFFTVLAKIK